MRLFHLSSLLHRFDKAPGPARRSRRRVRPSLQGLADGTGASPRPSFRPVLETLESRTVPSLIGSQFLQSTVSVRPVAVDFSATTDQTITLTATVGLMAGTVNGGTVNFTVVSNLGGTVLGTVNNVPVVNGVAQTAFTVPAGTPPGSYTITATFSGTGGSTGGSGSATLTITPPEMEDCESPAAAAFLGTAQRFAVLAGSAVTNTGPTVIIGDVGVSPGTSVTGFPPGSLGTGKPGSAGTIHIADAIAVQARNDVITAFGNLAGEPTTANLTGQDLGGLTLGPGVYRFNTGAQLTGTLILDAGGDPNARFDFQIGSTLTTASSSVVQVINGGLEDNVFWQVGSSATLGTATVFVGNILALTSITLNTRASIACGRVLAINGAVTLDTNFIDPIVLRASLVGGTLFVEGTPDADTIIIEPDADPTRLAVTVNGQGQGQFDLASIARITIDGFAGNDRITLGPTVPTNAKIMGGAGNDTLTGGAGDDTLDGGGGANRLAGGAGRDRIIGADVNRTWVITGTDAGRVGTTRFSAVEDLAGGARDDTFRFGKGASVTGTIDGGAGTNTLNYAAYTTTVNVNLLLGTATGTGGISNVANVVGGAGNDVLVGDLNGNELRGNAGRDILIGGWGRDTLRGGRGDDILVGGVTDQDTDSASLDALLAAWASGSPYLTRVTTAAGLLGAHDDGGTVDWLAGGLGRDWFLFGTGDVLTGVHGTETKTVV